jgi:hypothetical protein
MEWSLTGRPEDATLYADAATTSDYYRVINGKRDTRDELIKHVADMSWQGQRVQASLVSSFTPTLSFPPMRGWCIVVSTGHRGGFCSSFPRNEFLRDGDQLAARMTGTIKLGGVETEFESFMFAEVDGESGKMEWMIERAVWGAAGAAPQYGVN